MSDASREKYDRLLPRLERLKEEVVFTLTDAFRGAGIRTHAIPARVKDFDSLMEKAATKGWSDPFDSASDIVGARVVVLFASDIEPARKLIKTLFKVVKEDRKGTENVAQFGYSGLHFDNFLLESVTGPRYRDLHELKFEVQLRTIVEDAWAAVSHVLGYKGASSIPEHLQRDFYALSGLFYVADQHFEMFYKQAARAGKRAADEVADASSKSRRRVRPVPLNADTLVAFLAQRYPGRSQASLARAAELVPELEEHGDISSLPALVTLLDKTDTAFRAYEAAHPPRPGRKFGALGVARISLALASREYREALYGEGDVLEPFALDFL
jgi:putative GTP pyrophosphokinase